ncbi:hypothetical protein EAE32_08955 [Kocuria tytonicola]|uniref:Uncharacterized protein n=1 Tax=Kocuria tytonicola TaxID=2055946 RepID=A0A3L9L163_9MICC|nr:hypothetical protein [Kocuria tytonicola]RLY92440.1 hypothetical protein EAE32_08955 [Kocuria tytonicola]
MQETGVGRQGPGTVLDTPQDLAAAVEVVRAHPGPVEVTIGANRPVGSHMGSVVRRQVAQQLREAGAAPLLLRAPVAVDEDIPDEGVIAAVDDALGLCRGVGAEMLVLALGGVSHRGRQRQRLYSMLAALAEAASDHGVRLMVQNSSVVEEVLMLLALLDREHQQGTLDVTSPHVTSMAWDVSRSRAAGQPDDDAWHHVRRVADRAQVVVRGLDERDEEVLRRSLPGYREQCLRGRILPVLTR